MPDRYDDSVPRRSANGSGARRADLPKATDEDPLVELARLVSGTENFDDIIGKRPVTQSQPQASSPRAGGVGRGLPRDASFDLESELLSDLQSSFDPAPPPASARAAAAPRPPVRENSFDNLRLRGGAVPPAPPMPPASPRYAPPPARSPAEDDDPYVGTAYAGAAGYDNYADNGRAAPYRPVQQPTDDEASGYAAAYADAGGVHDQEYRAYDQGDFEGAESYEDDGIYGDEPARRSRKGLIIAAVVLGLVLVGGAGAIALRSNGTSLMGNGTPKVIAADEGPTKVKPAVQPDTDGGQQNKLIYDRANPDTGANDQLVVPNNGAADGTPANTESQGSREISRIILPGAPGDQSAPDSNATPAPQAGSNDTGEPDVGPRRVRTVVVKPDGTIISSEAQPKGGDGASGTPPATALNDNTADAPTPLSNAPATDAPTSLAPPADTPPAGNSAADSGAGKDDSQMAPAPEPKPARKQVAAATPPARPAPADSADAPAGGTGGYVVQVSSQRTEDQARAAYKGLQRKFPSVLGSREANIAKADLGTKGVFYRARIGPWNSRDDAASFCESLRSAGGDCIIQKN